MKILVLGGSYFYGRVFVMLASQIGTHEITVLNRGTYSMAEYGVKQITGDRHSREAIEACAEDYDAVVDFCAYEAGDVRFVLEHLLGQVGQYILISTVDVYQRGTGVVKSESAPLEKRQFAGEAGAYIAGKVALEEELRQACGARRTAYTVLRPAILYGPYNYAPRESVYIQMLVCNHVLPRFRDADGSFQFVYVKDAAQAAVNCLGNEKTYGQAYNLCQDQIVTYGSFLDALKEAAEPEVTAALQEVETTVEEAEAQGVPIPFPARAQETELCDNAKSREELGMVYTDFQEGIRRTYRAFRNVYGERAEELPD